MIPNAWGEQNRLQKLPPFGWGAFLGEGGVWSWILEVSVIEGQNHLQMHSRDRSTADFSDEASCKVPMVSK